MRFIKILLLTVFATMAEPSAWATVYHLEFEGEIDIVTFAFSDLVSVGDTARFSILYDTDAVDSNPSATSGSFAHAIVGEPVTTFGGHVFETRAVSRLRTGSGISSSLGYTSGGGIVGSRNGVVTFDLASSDPNVLQPNALPTMLDLAAFDRRSNFQFVAPSGGIAGTISSLSVTAVPLPASGLLILGGLFTLVLLRRRETL